MHVHVYVYSCAFIVLKIMPKGYQNPARIAKKGSRRGSGGPRVGQRGRNGIQAGSKREKTFENKIKEADWNAFRTMNKGKGWKRAKFSSEYKLHKAALARQHM